jgi:hypothetical protein
MMNFKLALLAAGALLAAAPLAAAPLAAAPLAGAQPLPNNFWPNSTFNSGTNLGQFDGLPTGWVRAGTLTNIDQMTNVDWPNSSNALMVINESGALGYGEWDCAVPLAGVANPGDTINLRYNLMYSVKDNEMRVALGFLDASGSYISADQFVVQGDSPGWNGGVDSTFTETNQTALVPIGTVYINVGVVSGGTPGTAGVLIVGDISVARAPTPELLPNNFWPNPSFESGTNLDQTNGIPTGWNVYNSGSSYITQIATNNYVSASHALEVVDNDSGNYGSWYSDLIPLAGHAKPGGSLNVQYYQLYSISKDNMRVTFSFYNAASKDVGDISFQVTGNSPGWRGAVEGSSFTKVNQLITVPPNSTQFLVQLVSAGDIDAEGIMLIDDLSIAPPETPPILPGNFWPNPSFSAGVNLSKTTGTPTGWVRAGSLTTIDEVVTVNNAPTYALAVVDKSTTAYGEWDGDLTLSPSNAVPGNLVNIQYSALYSVTNGPMWLSVLFFDSTTNILSSTNFNMTGNSDGWNGAIASSTFTLESSQVVVPAHAARMRFALASGAPGSATGVLLIDGLSAAVQVVPVIPPTVLADNFFPNPTFEAGVSLDTPALGNPAGGWLRGGSSSIIDQVTTSNWTSPTHSLELLDNDTNNYGEWYLIFNLAGLATNGDALDLQWFELHNTTNGNMRLTFEFFDTNNTDLQHFDFNTASNGTNAGGSSTNWQGLVGPPSTFDQQFQRLVLPLGASELQVHFASGGSSFVTGVFLIDDLSVRLSPPDVTSITDQPGTGVTLVWNSMATKTYSVLFSSALSTNAADWTPLATGIYGSFPSASYTDTVNHGPGSGFYLIKQE